MLLLLLLLLLLLSLLLYHHYTAAVAVAAAGGGLKDKYVNSLWIMQVFMLLYQKIKTILLKYEQ